jgi:peptide/nickel transport system permease protein
MTQIKGTVPSPADFPKGCRFADRCPMADETCRTTAPDLVGARTHLAACHHPAIDLTTPEPTEPTESEAVK